MRLLFPLNRQILSFSGPPTKARIKRKARNVALVRPLAAVNWHLRLAL
jgi:hypothetical protein